MTYGYIYVAQIALGANPNRLSRPSLRLRLTPARL